MNSCTAIIKSFPKSLSYIGFLSLYPKSIFYDGKGELIRHIDEISYLAGAKKSVWVKQLRKPMPASSLMHMQAFYLLKNIRNQEYYYYISKPYHLRVRNIVNKQNKSRKAT